MSLNVIFDNGTHKIESAGVASEPPPSTKVTKLKFKQRLTQAERIAIRLAAKTNEIVEDFLDLIKDAEYIDLSLTETIGGVQYLEAAGIIAVGRADEILNTPVAYDEIPN